MNDPTPTRADLIGSASPRDPASRAVLPLWIAAIGLAVIAVVMIVTSIELVHAVRSTEASVVQLQQELSQLKSGLGGLLGN